MSANNLNVKPNEMVSECNKLGQHIEAYNATVTQIYKLVEDMNSNWEGPARDALNHTLNEAGKDFKVLEEMMIVYRDTINKVAQKYTDSENKAIGLLKR